MSSEKFQGKRLPDDVNRSFANPGDFWRASRPGGGWEWEVISPDGNTGSLGGYHVVEHDDRSISVMGVIINHVDPVNWRLVCGEWTRDNLAAAA